MLKDIERLERISGLPNFVGYRNEERNGRQTKVPYQCENPNVRASTTDPSTWSYLEDAIVAMNMYGFDGIGFVFTKECGVVGIDLDHCIDVNGVPDPEAIEILTALQSYTEISPSGTGFHCLVEAVLSGAGINKKRLEMYDDGRFFTLTGNRFGHHTKINANQEAVDRLYEQYKTPPETPVNPGQVIQLKSHGDIDRLIEKLLLDHYFKQLWDRKVAMHKSQSEYDLAISNKCRQASCTDTEVQEVIHRHRLKWNQKPEKALRPDYMKRTLLIAAAIPEVVTAATDDFFVDAAKITHNPKKITWLIKGYIPRGGIIWMAGEWSAFKTFQALSMAYHIALGRDWCGLRTVKGKVVYIAGEGFSGLGKRLRGLEIYHKEVLGEGLIEMASQAVFLNDQQQLSMLINNIMLKFHGEPPVMIIVDTKSANMAGSDSDPALMNTWINNIRMLERELDCTVLVIDHVGHMDKSRPRGASQQMGAADAVYMLKRDEDLDTVVMATEKDPKDFESPPPLTFKATSIDLPEDWDDEDGDTVNTLVLHPIQNVEVEILKPERETPNLSRVGGQTLKMLDILKGMYTGVRIELEARGDDATPKIRTLDWKKVCEKEPHNIGRSSVNYSLDALLARGLIVRDADGIHVYVVKQES